MPIKFFVIKKLIFDVNFIEKITVKKNIKKIKFFNKVKIKLVIPETL